MKPLRRLVTTVHGSHLYGTSTPESDRDYKGVHLPSGRGILLQRPENVFDESIKAKNAAGKNTGDAIDHQSYSVEKFCRMLAIGDGFATEILFAPDDCIVEAAPGWDALKEEAKVLLNREVKGFVGYCKQQAAKYGVKGSRMEAVEKLVILLSDGADTSGNVLPADVAKLARRLGIRVYTIALGPEDKETRPNDPDAVDTATLRLIAEESGGRTFRVRDTADLEAVTAAIDRLEASGLDRPPATVRRDLWIYPAMAAFACSLFLVVSRRAL